MEEDLALAALGQLGDEGAVDLQHVDRELAQVGERGVAGAEVVDGDPDPERLQLAQPPRGFLGVASSAPSR